MKIFIHHNNGSIIKKLKKIKSIEYLQEEIESNFCLTLTRDISAFAAFGILAFIIGIIITIIIIIIMSHCYTIAWDR